MDATDLSPEAWREAIAHPLFTPLAPWLSQLPAARADRETFNRFAAQTPQYTGGGKRLQFVAPEKEDGIGYEARIFTQGQVPTRENNLHDLFNALTWLACPRSKAALNARHVQRMASEGKQRGRFGDLLTLLDEGGILIASTDPQLETLLRQQQWHALFIEQRARVQSHWRVWVLGHATFESGLRPYPGITCKCLVLPMDQATLEAEPTRFGQAIDHAAARWISAVPETAVPGSLAPLPIFGLPGWYAGNDHPDFYAQTRWFRTKRTPLEPLPQVCV